MENKQLITVNADDLSLVENNSLNASQLKILLKETPAQYVHKRPAKGGGEWKYVSGGYVRKCLNLLFGWDWSFEVIDEKILHGEVIVKGKLTCNSNGHSIVKMQFGNKDIIYKKQSEEDKKNGVERIPLSIGNDLKAAATDCLKKCAAEIGLAADIYNEMDFKPVNVEESEDILTEIKTLYELKREDMKIEDREHTERIIEGKETASYTKLLKILKAA